MATAEPIVYSTINDDGSAEFTIAVDGEDHKFSASPNNGTTAVISYQETLSNRFQIRVKEPDNEVFKLLMQSDEVTEYLEREGLTTIRREKHD